MPLSDWSEKQKLMLTAGVVGGVLLITAGLLFYVLSQYNDLVSEYELLDPEVRKLKKEGERLPEVKRELEKVMMENRTVYERVPEEKRSDDFIAQITEQARNSQLAVKSMEVIDDTSNQRRRTKSKSPYKPLKMKLRCEGGYHELGEFVNRIERRMARLVSVQSFRITGNGDGLELETKMMTIELTIQTYWYDKPGKKS